MAPITRIGQGGLRAKAVDVETTRLLSDDDLVLSLARGYLRYRLGCQDVGGGAAAERVALLAEAGGLSSAQVADELPAQAVQQVSDVARTPADQVSTWYDAGLAHIRCVPAS